MSRASLSGRVLLQARYNHHHILVEDCELKDHQEICDKPSLTFLITFYGHFTGLLFAKCITQFT